MIKQFLYTPEEKLQFFGEGEWVDEPDFVEFEYRGFFCQVKRYTNDDFGCALYGGNLCGFVEVPKDHPYYQKNYDDIPMVAHGGLTFSGMDHERFFIGFDCAHRNDLVPFYRKFLLSIFSSERINNITKTTYKNVEFCIEQCKSIVGQLIDLQNAVVT